MVRWFIRTNATVVYVDAYIHYRYMLL